MRVTALLTGLWVLLCVSAGVAGPPSSITLMTHDSFSASKTVIAAFEKTHNAKIEFLKAGDAGAALNQAILSLSNPLADVFFGVDNTFMSRALTWDIFEPYASPLLAKIPDALKLDRGNRLLPVDFGDVCLNYDKKWFAGHHLTPPASLEDLIKPEFASLTVVQNPATSSPGLAFLIATIEHFGENGYLQYWQDLKKNKVLVTPGWKEAYWGHFSAASKGTRPVVVSYASSPAAEVHYAEKKLAAAPTAAVIAPGTCFRQIEFAGILKGTKNQGLARKLVDFLLDLPFQEDIPLQMFVFPANQMARLPEVYVRHAQSSLVPAVSDPQKIGQNRDKWIMNWTALMMR